MEDVEIGQAMCTFCSTAVASSCLQWLYVSCYVVEADVTNPESLLAALTGVSAVVFAVWPSDFQLHNTCGRDIAIIKAAYSRGKTQPEDVDNDAWPAAHVVLRAVPKFILWT